MKKTLICITLVLAALLTTAWSQTASRPSWEYKFEYNMNEKKANQLGADGWELVTASAAGSGPLSNVETFVFKRPKN